MPSHEEIDQRSLALARAVAQKIDCNEELLDGVRRWAQAQSAPAYREWSEYLAKPWPEVRKVLLDPSEEGCRLRQSSPFVGILSNRERWSFFPVANPRIAVEGREP